MKLNFWYWQSEDVRIPLLREEEWPRHQEIPPEASFDGADGVVILESSFRPTTPSVLSRVASQLFLDAQPPLLSQEGSTLPRE